MRGLVYFIILFFCASVGLGTASASVEKATRYVVEAETFSEAGNYRSALIQFQNAMRHDPADMTIKLRMGETLIHLEDYARAERILSVVSKRAPSSRATLRLAEAMYAQWRLSEALSLLRSQDSDQRQKALGHVIKADLLLGKAKPQEALVEAEFAFGSEFEVHAKLVRAKSHYALGDANAAQAELAVVMQKYTRSFQAMLLKARISLKTGDTQNAIKLAQKIQAIDEGNVSAGALIVEAMLKEKKYKEAALEITKLKPVNENDPRPKYLKALLFLAQGETEKAEMYISEISYWLATVPHGPAFIARIQYLNGNYVQAEKVLRDRLAKKPHDLEALALLIRTAMTAHKPDLADTLLAQGFEHHPGHPILMQLKAFRLVEQGQVNAAAEIYQKIAQHQDAAGQSAQFLLSVAGLHDGYGGITDTAMQDYGLAVMESMTHLRNGRAKLAVAAATQAIKFAQKNDPLPYNMLGVAHLANGNETEARKALAVALERDPAFVAALINLSRIEIRAGNLKALEQNLRTARQKVPKNVFVALELIDVLRTKGQNAEAIFIANEINQFTPGNAEIAARLSQLYLLTGTPDKAQSVAETLLRASQGKPETIMVVADIFEAAGRPDKAVSALTRVKGVTTTASSYRQRLVAAYIAADRPVDALKRLKDFSVGEPTGLKYQEQIAFLQLETGDAVGAYATAKVLQSRDYAKGSALKALLMAAEGKSQQAYIAIKAAFETKPSSYLARQRYLIGRNTAQDDAAHLVALKELQGWCDAHLDDAESHFLLGNAWLARGELGQAEKALTIALAGRTTDAVLRNNLAWTRFKLNRSGALEMARTAYALAPSNPDVIDTYGYILGVSGRPERGLKLLNEALVFSNKKQEVKAHIAELEASRDRLTGKSRLR